MSEPMDKPAFAEPMLVAEPIAIAFQVMRDDGQWASYDLSTVLHPEVIGWLRHGCSFRIVLYGQLGALTTVPQPGEPEQP